MKLMFLQFKDKLDRKFGCFEVFGFDFMLDDQLNPYMLEVNMNPAMFLDTNCMKELLPKIVHDCCNLAVEIHKPHTKQANTDLIEELVHSEQLCKLKYQVLYKDQLDVQEDQPNEIAKVEIT